MTKAFSLAIATALFIPAASAALQLAAQIVT